MPHIKEQSAYSVVVRRRGRPGRWGYEIRRLPAMGVKLYETGFRTESAAKLAGEKQLHRLKEAMARERLE